MSWGKTVWSVLASLAIVTLFAEIWSAMFGWLRLESRGVIAVAGLCALLAIISAANIDPPAKN